MSDPTSTSPAPGKPPGLSPGDWVLGAGCAATLGCAWLVTLPLRPIFFLFDLPRRWRQKFRKTAYRENKTIDTAPFPLLTWDGVDSWRGSINLSEWNGIWEDGGEGYKKPPAGEKISFGVIATDPVYDALPSQEQKAACSFLFENGQETVRAVLDAVAPLYSKCVDDFAADEYALPPIESPDDLRNKLRLLGIDFHPESRGEKAIISLSLAWLPDPEHGLGVMMHQCDVIEVGAGELCGDRDASRRVNTYTHPQLGDFLWEDNLEDWIGPMPTTPFDSWTNDIVISHWNGSPVGEYAFKLWSKHQQEEGVHEDAEPPELSILRPEGFSPPRTEQLAAIDFLSQLPASVEREIRDRFLAEMEREEESARNGCQDEERRKRFDERLKTHQATGDAGVTKRAGLTSASILATAVDGIAFSVLSFGVSWDCEHGACILLHGHRVLAMDQHMVFDDLSARSLRKYLDA
jgi:hypothetical protein